MAASKSYFARAANYRFLSSERDAPIVSETAFELDESEVWNSNRSASPEFRKAIPSSRASKKASAKRVGNEAGARPASLPVNVPDWSKILKEDYTDNRRRDSDDDDDGEDDGNRIPPHEFLARQLARSRIASFSVHEGIGRTLKGRDLSRVRNAIWEKTGFQD
ncbi:protein S40-4-like [Cornus florida]|uniref:protein S40-4-like n=1 Tax=Cornus florida TaxID=4283 RepID=UPI002898BDF8|nr:protein S40-4-like [Cornus florida]